MDGETKALLVGDPWEELGGAPDVAFNTFGAASATDSALWAVTSSDLVRFDEEGWSSFPQIGGEPRAIVPRADGTVAVLSVDDSCPNDCSTAKNILSIMEGASGRSFPTEDRDELHDMVEVASGELVAVGDGSWVAAWLGSSWGTLYKGGPESLRAAIADGDNLVAVGDGGLVLRGHVSDLAPERIGDEDLQAVDMGEDGTAWVLGRSSVFIDDGAWTEVALPEGQWADIEATLEGALVVGSQTGPTALAVDRDGWSVAWQQGSISTVNDIWIDDEGDPWFAASDGVGRWNDSGLQAWGILGGVNAIAGSSPNDVVAIGLREVFQWDGEALSQAYADENIDLFDVAAVSDGTVFAAGRQRLSDRETLPVLLRRDAGLWRVDPTPIPAAARSLVGVVAFASDDVYALAWGSPSALLHFDGSAWTEIVDDLGSGYGVLWGRSGADIYIGKSSWGQGPPLLHWDGSLLRPLTGAPPSVRSLAGTDAALLVATTNGLDYYDIPTLSMWQDGVWTEMLRESPDGWPHAHMAVGARGDIAVLSDSFDAMRGPLSSW